MALCTGSLQWGQMGYVRFGLKDPRQAQPGTVLMMKSICPSSLPTLPEWLQAISVLYASVHPTGRECHGKSRISIEYNHYKGPEYKVLSQ